MKQPRPSTLALVVSFAMLTFVTPNHARAQSDCDAAELAEEGQEAFVEEEYEEAVVRLTEARACEDVPILAYNLARAYQELGRCIPARDLFAAYLESGDEARRSQALRREAETAECADAYESALEASDLAREAGDFDGALNAIDQALELSPEPPTTIMRGEVLIELGRCDEASEILAEVDRDQLSRTQSGVLDAALDGATNCEAPADPVECLAGCEDERDLLLAEHDSAVAGQRTAGIIVTAVGGATLLAAVVHDLAGQSTIDEFEAAAAAGDRVAFESLRSELGDRRTVSTVLYGSGMLITVVGGAIWLWSGRASPADAIDCDSLCWDGGLDGPGDFGGWVGARF